MRAERRLILHVGTHKTGTTAFQASLRANAEALAARGVGAVFETVARADGRDGRRYNLARLANLFIRPGLVTGHRLRHGQGRAPSALARAWRRWRAARAFARRPEPDLLLSAEAFCFLRSPGEAAAMRRFLAATGRRPVILLALRGEAGWRESWQRQLDKVAEVRAGLAEVAPGDRIDGAWYFDAAAIRAFWSDLGELRQIDYDAEVAATGSIVARLYREAGIDPAGLATDQRRNARDDEG